MLSNLPENMQEIVLTLLPIKDAVRTSILSKSWRYKWTLIPKIMIDESELDGDYGFVRAVDTIFELHDGPIQKFYLDACCDQEDDINRWIHGLSRRGIRELTLRAGLLIGASSDIFSCKHLSYLSLSGGDIEVPVKCHGFEFLNTLELLCVTFLEEDLKKLVSSCSQLKKLVLSTILDYIALNICALNLENLDIDGQFSDLVLCAPKLLNLYLYQDLRDGEVDDFVELNLPRIFRALPNLERLEMNSFIVTHCSGPLRYATPVFLNCLKEIDLTLRFKDEVETAFAFSLFETAPDQEDTSITASGMVARWETTYRRDVLLKHLQDMKIEGSGSLHSLISLTKFILRSASKLKNLKFWTWEKWPHQFEGRNPKPGFSDPLKLRFCWGSRLC